MGLIMFLVSGVSNLPMFENDMFLRDEIINGLINIALCSV